MTDEEKKAAEAKKAELKAKADKALTDAGIDPTQGSYVPGPEPEIDAAKIKGLSGAIKGAMKEFVEENRGSEDDYVEEDDDTANRGTPQPRDSDPLRDAVAPMVQPALDKINLTAQDAKDASLFYATHPKAIKHSKEIEAAFNKMAAQGTPQTRESLLEWYIGRNFEKFHKERVEEDAAAAERAKAAQTVDAAGNPITPGAPIQVDENTSDEDLNKALQNVVF